MPEEIPPWEVLLVARDDGRYNVLLRIHHAIADGVTLVRLCVEALVDTPLPPPPVGPPPPTPFVRFAFIMWSMLMLPFGIIKLMTNTDKNCLHGPPLSGNKVMTWSKGMPLSVLRQVKNNASTTINDVLMSCLSAALAKHFAHRKDDVQGVTVVVPVSFHDLRKPLVLTNMFSIATVKIPVGKALAPNARLKAVKEVLDTTKKDPTLWAVHWVVKSASELLPASVASLLFNSHGLTLAASNVPGPQQEITIWGDKVEDIMFWVPNRGPVGVGVSFFSYKGMVKVGLNVDLALIPSKAEAQQLLVDMEEELRILHGRLLPQA
ncbi:putative diacylglycerol O-acyltransferase [Chionoecetes opilio]|uniref:Putative diacylglycerol O-acyltransferase n=1 Tax=Chionoecetes opilio TaxID=41210 RepID=A0A8J4XNF7_CHIOP|nr:putative diacylglycerol O-acyltransferase [Chionoecetes opilio]